MSRTRHSLDVMPAEVRRIQELYVAGVRVADIVRMMGRCEAVVQRNVRGIKRRRPHPPARNADRDKEIVELVSRRRRSLDEVAALFGLCKTRICQIVRLGLGLISKKMPKSARVVPSRLPPPKPPKQRAMTSKQRTARDRRIASLVREGLPLQALAIRFGVSKLRIRQITQRAEARRKRTQQRAPRNRKVARLARKGLGPTAIGRRVGLSVGGVAYILRRMATEK